MSNFPAKVATPILVTGKTDKSQVVDVYDASGIQQRAQNAINSVLNSADGTIFESTKNAAVKLLDAKNFYPGMNKILNDFAKGGYTKDSLKSALNGYKDGALKSILDANGIKDLKGLKDNILGSIETNVKDFSFGMVSGFVDGLSPGILDSVGVKSFSDAKKLYENMDAMVNDFKNMNTEAWIDATLPFAVGMSTGALQTSLDLINETMGSSLKITSTDLEIDNAILTGVCKGMIAEDNPYMNDFVFTSFDNLDASVKSKKLEMFVSSTVSDAAKNGSMDYLVKAANKTSKSFVSANINMEPEDFLANISIADLYTQQTKEKALELRATAESNMISSLAIVSGKEPEEFTLDMFTKISKDGKEVLKYSAEWAESVALSEGLTVYDPMTLPDLFPDYFW